jgi:hypothetical protein
LDVVDCVKCSFDVKLSERSDRAFAPRRSDDVCDDPYCQFCRAFSPVSHLGLREKPLLFCCVCNTPAHDCLDRFAQGTEKRDWAPGSGFLLFF